jgi:tRNA (guanosine-2'-O-)-methyltransferase
MTPEREARIDSVISNRQNDLTVVLENVFDPHNISAIMRNCDAVGIGEIYVLNTRLPLHKEWGFKSSRSALKWVHVHQFTDLHLCMKAVRARHDRVLTTCLRDDSLSLYSVDLTGGTALVFGNEQHGISPELETLCDGNFVIPQVGMLHSLNISVACAVTLYEAFRQRSEKGRYDTQQLPADAANTLKVKWSENNANE